MISIPKIPENECFKFSTIDPIVNQRMEIEKVKAIVTNLSNPILWNFIQLYEHSRVSWEFAMQEAAIILAQQLDETQNKLIQYMQKVWRD